MMPIYEYKCLACGHSFELYMKKPDPPPALPCPKCNGPAGKMVSPVSFRLKNNTCGGFTNTRGEVVGCDKAPGPNIDKPK